MLYLFFTILLLIPVLAGFGALFQKIFGDFFTGFSSKLVVGIFSLALFWQILVFFVPLNIYVEVFSIAIGLFSFFYFKVHLEIWKFLNGI